LAQRIAMASADDSFKTFVESDGHRGRTIGDSSGVVPGTDLAPRRDLGQGAE
jgi:hypothetical protein